MFFYARQRNVFFHTVHVSQKRQQHAKKLRLFFISDIHRRKVDGTLMKKLRSAGPVDYVIIGGDLAEGGVPLRRIAKNVERLSELAPIFYVWGNNDREAGEQDIRDILNGCGAVILDNMNMALPNHPSWGISGMDDPSSRKVVVDSALRYIENYKYSIAIAHNPALFSKIKSIHQPTLLLAGHTHGGQIRLGPYGIQDLGSFHEEDGNYRLISNGYGTSTVPFRLGAQPESHIIDIYYDE